MFNFLAYNFWLNILGAGRPRCPCLKGGTVYAEGPIGPVGRVNADVEITVKRSGNGAVAQIATIEHDHNAAHVGTYVTIITNRAGAVTAYCCAIIGKRPAAIIDKGFNRALIRGYSGGPVGDDRSQEH